MRKKILSLLLVCTTLLSFAAVPTRAENIDFDHSSFLEYLGVTLPEDDGDAERPILKSEFVYLVIKAMGNNSFAEKEYLTFPDVKLDAWYHDNVIAAANMGIVYGHEDGTFGTEDTVSEETAAVIMLRALGFGMLPGNSVNTNLREKYSSVFSDLMKRTTRDASLTVAEAYEMLHNMLMSDYVALNLDDKVGSYRVGTEKSYIESAFDIAKETGRVTGNEYTRFGLAGEKLPAKNIEIDGKLYDTTIENADELLGYCVDYYISDPGGSDETVVWAIPTDKNKVTEISSQDLSSVDISGSDIVLKYKKNGKNTGSVRVPLSTDFVYNGKTADFSKTLVNDLMQKYVGNVKIVEYKNKYMLFVTAYETVVVDTVSTYDEAVYGRNGEQAVSVKEPDSGEFLTVIKDGAVCAVSDIQKDDVLQVAETLDKRSKKIIICKNTMSGAVTMSLNEGEIGIDGVTYKVSNYFTLYRAAYVNMQLGIKQKFLFNTAGELVDIIDGSAEYEGEYVFLIEAKDMSGDYEHYCRIKYATLDANVVTAYLAEKVRLNGTRCYADEAVAKPLLPRVGGKLQRRMIYIEKNADGNISVINTPDQRDIYATFNANEVIELEASEKQRKCKASSIFLVDTNDSNYPEFYIDGTTKILMVPKSDASDDIFLDSSSYAKKSTSDFRDAQNYYVEAYNFNDYNVAQIMLLRQEQTFDTRMSNNGCILVTGVGQTVDEDGVAVPVVRGWQKGQQVEVKLKDTSVLTYTKNNLPHTIKKHDIVRFNLNNEGYATHNEYIKNIDTDFAITDYPEGRNDGNTYVIGKVVSYDGNYLRLRFTENASVKERVFRGNLSTVTIYDGFGETGTERDLTPGSLVMLRVFYSEIQDIFVIK